MYTLLLIMFYSAAWVNNMFYFIIFFKCTSFSMNLRDQCLWVKWNGWLLFSLNTLNISTLIFFSGETWTRPLISLWCMGLFMWFGIFHNRVILILGLCFDTLMWNVNKNSGLCTCNKNLEKNYQREWLCLQWMYPRSVSYLHHFENCFYIKTMWAFNSLPWAMSCNMFISYDCLSFTSLINKMYFSWY